MTDAQFLSILFALSGIAVFCDRSPRSYSEIWGPVFMLTAMIVGGYAVMF